MNLFERQGFNGTVLNPRRAHFPVGDPDATPSQVTWEYRHLRKADAILFWFPASPSTQPIALFELGAALERTAPVAVGCDPGYSRRLDVRLQLAHAAPSAVLHNTLQATVNAALASLPPR
ncbi:nucleoside 2-deoxyribosyltransferase domain-containing protein [Streptomyces bluensis]|uniref:nucleoside 2-deoxyribosyltransferase domain-containing protein n=1 Tax=Streptomyces bluensis TaxID=33897 RepID=UPI0033169BDF